MRLHQEGLTRRIIILGFDRLFHLIIALPSLMLQGEHFKGHRCAIGVQLTQGDILRRPAAIDSPGLSQLPGFVVKLDDDFLEDTIDFQKVNR